MRKVDITLLVTAEIQADANKNLKKSLTGHLGTHFDVMNKVFPLDYTERKGIVFDVSKITLSTTMVDEKLHYGEVKLGDVDLSLVEKDMFVAFYTGFLVKVGYGNHDYFSNQPTISLDLVKALIAKGISIIGVDMAGVRQGKEHVMTDQLCADHGVFVVENLCNFPELLGGNPYAYFWAHTYPINFSGWTGLPCRVIAEVEEP